MRSYVPKFVGKKTMGQLMYWSRKMMSEYDVKVSIIIDTSNVALSGYTIGGFYDPMHQYGETAIELYIVFNEMDKKTLFDVSECGARLIVDEIFKTYVHENRHRYQFRKKGKACARQYKSTVADLDLQYEMEYYGDADEIDAYAQEAVIEMRLIGYSAALEKYKELFAKNDPVVYNRFLKKCYKFEDKISL